MRRRSIWKCWPLLGAAALILVSTLQWGAFPNGIVPKRARFNRYSATLNTRTNSDLGADLRTTDLRTIASLLQRGPSITSIDANKDSSRMAALTLKNANNIGREDGHEQREVLVDKRVLLLQEISVNQIFDKSKLEEIENDRVIAAHGREEVPGYEVQLSKQELVGEQNISQELSQPHAQNPEQQQERPRLGVRESFPRVLGEPYKTDTKVEAKEVMRKEHVAIGKHAGVGKETNDTTVVVSGDRGDAKPRKTLKRVRVIRKTIVGGKVVREEVIGVKTVEVTRNGTQSSNKINQYDGRWYKDIINGKFTANLLSLTNKTGNWPMLTKRLWKFEDPDSERLFLYNKLLQQDWKQNHTHLYHLRQELLQNGVNFPENLVITRKNTPLNTSLPNFIATTTFINGSMTHLRYYNATSEFRRHLPSYSPFRNTVHKKCAVVGNSGALLNSGCGKDIDSFDMIFRCNAAPIKKFAEDAGTKSNITTFNPSIFVKRYNYLRSPDDYRQFQYDMTQYNGYIWLPCIATASTLHMCLSTILSDQPRMPNSPWLVVANPIELIRFNDFWKERHFSKRPSTGFLMSHAALQLCEEVHLYGFWPFPLRLDSAFERVPYHYFDDILVSSSHNMNEEFSIFMQYHMLGILRLHTGKCEAR